MSVNSVQTKANVSHSGATVPVEQIPENAAKPSLLLRKDQLAHELNMSPRSIQNLMSRKMIPYYRLSSRFLRFDLRKVRNALDKFEVKEVGRDR
jgi:hypothetical protein